MTDTKTDTKTEESTTKDSDMPLIDVRKAALDATYAAVGVADFAAEKVFEAQAKVDAFRDDVTSRTLSGEIKKITKQVSDVPAQVSETFEELAGRGRGVVGKVSTNDSTSTLWTQMNHTVSRGRAAWTTARRAAEAAVGAAAGSAHDVVESTAEVVDDVAESAETAATEAAAATAKARATARKSASRTKKAAKGAATSATKTAKAATKAAADAASELGSDAKADTKAEAKDA